MYAPLHAPSPLPAKVLAFGVSRLQHLVSTLNMWLAVSPYVIGIASGLNTMLYNKSGSHGQPAVSQNTQFYKHFYSHNTTSAYFGVLQG